MLNGDINNNGMDDRREFVITAPANTALRQFGVFGNNNIGVWDHSGESTYHSLQTQFVSRFGSGSQFQMSYTLARSRANYAMTDSGQLAANTTRLDNQDPDRDWGRPETGRTHVFNSSIIWMLPSMEGQLEAIARAVAGNWEIAGIIGAGTGQPLTVYTGSLPGFNGGPSGTGYNDNQRPTASRASRAAPAVVRMSRSSIRTRIPSTDSSSDRSAAPSAATAPVRAISRPTWRSTRTFLWGMA